MALQLASEWRLDLRKTNLVSSVLELWVGLASSGSGGCGSWRLNSIMWPVIYQPCLCNENPIKTLDTEAHWSSLVGELIDVPVG